MPHHFLWVEKNSSPKSDQETGLWSDTVILLLTPEYLMFDFLPKPWNLWVNVESSLTRASDHGELDRAGESNPGACIILGNYGGESALPTL